MGYIVTNRYFIQPVKLLSAILLLGLLSGCGIGTEPLRAESGNPTKPTLPEKPAQADTVRGDTDPAVVTLKIGNALKQKPLNGSEVLPDIGKLGPINFNGVPVALALKAVLSGTDISLSWPTGEYEDSLVTAFNLSGNLQTVVERICNSAGVYCAYRNGNIEIKDEETFIIELPAVLATGDDTIATAIGSLTGGEVTSDTQGGYLLYTTNMTGHLRVQDYLKNLRRGRPLIVLQLYIWDVALTDTYSTGIRWDAPTLLNNLALPGGRPTKLDTFAFGNNISSGTPGNLASNIRSGALANAVSFGAVFTGNLDLGLMMSFLSEFGTVEAVSSPQMTFISGMESEFRVGGQRNFISGVGTSSSTTGDSTTGGSTSSSGNTVQTDSVDVGLTVQASGRYENGVIFGQLQLDETSLVALREVSSSGTTIQLPETQERALTTSLRLRPGDTMLLAGIRRSRDDTNRRGLPTPFGQIPMSSTNALENSELVIMIKPSIIRFEDEDDDDQSLGVAATRAPTPEVKKPVEAPMPETVSMPEAAPVAAAPITASVPVMPTVPEPMPAAPQTVPQDLLPPIARGKATEPANVSENIVAPDAAPSVAPIVAPSVAPSAPPKARAAAAPVAAPAPSAPPAAIRANALQDALGQILREAAP